MTGRPPLLEIDNLDVNYRVGDEQLRAVSGASFRIEENRYFGLVGESGCGKSTIAKSLINALDANGQIAGGSVIFRGDEIQELTEAEFKDQYLWNEIAFIPQSAMNSLDPLMKVSEQATKIAKEHTDWSEEEALERFKELFDVVGLPESRIHHYPHQFSGGMKQRTIIALALLLQPSLIIADEPTTALDVIMQDQILNHLQEIRQDRNLSMLIITHDISVVFENCDDVAVMHGGQVAETGGVVDIYQRPRHPYTILLQRAFPDVRFRDRPLETIDGEPPVLRQPMEFCSFANRCPWAQEECEEGSPPLERVPDPSANISRPEVSGIGEHAGDAGSDHYSSCIRHSEMEELATSHLTEIEERHATSPGQ